VVSTFRGVLSKITTSNEELITVRDAMREMPRLIQALKNKDGGVEKYVLMKNGRMVAVLLDVDDYIKMTEEVV
jgi:hypothetical protein